MATPDTFGARYRVRFDEADATGSLRPSGFLRYAQDLAWQHAEAAGFDRQWHASRDTTWVVRSVVLALDGAAKYGDDLLARTAVTGWSRSLAHRQTDFSHPDEPPIARADTDWVLLDSAGRLVRVPEELSRHFDASATVRPQRVRIGTAPADAAAWESSIRRADTDPLGHLNNAAYLDLLDEAIARRSDGSARHSHYRAEYLRPALPGSNVLIRTWPHEHGGIGCLMSDASGNDLLRAIVGR